MRQCNLRNYKGRKNCERDTGVDESLRRKFCFVLFLVTRDFCPLIVSNRKSKGNLSKLKFVIEVLRNYVFVMF